MFRRTLSCSQGETRDINKEERAVSITPMVGEGW